MLGVLFRPDPLPLPCVHRGSVFSFCCPLHRLTRGSSSHGGNGQHF